MNKPSVENVMRAMADLKQAFSFSHVDNVLLDEFYAVEVKPHGRLIDADALPWENQGLMLTDPDEWGLKAWDIEHAPTIIPAEEVNDV